MSLLNSKIFTPTINLALTQTRKNHTFSCFSFCLAKAKQNPSALQLKESVDLSYTMLGNILKDQGVPFHSILPFTTPAHQAAFTKGYQSTNTIENTKKDFERSIINLKGTVKYSSDIGLIDDNSFSNHGPELSANFKALTDTHVVIIPMFGEIKGKDVPPGKKKYMPHYISVNTATEGRYQGYNPVNSNSTLIQFPRSFLRTLVSKKKEFEVPMVCFLKKEKGKGAMV